MSRFSLVLLAATLLVASNTVAQCTTTPRSSDPGFSNAGATPAISGSVLSAARAARTGTAQRIGCSEVANLTGTHQDGAPATVTWPRDNCPHLSPTLTPWETFFTTPVTAGQNVLIPAGTHLLLRPCSLQAGTPNPTLVLGRVRIEGGASLTFDDQDIVFRAREIYVDPAASINIGSATCRLYSKVEIMLHAPASGSVAPTNGVLSGATTKGIQVFGVLDFHGKQYSPTWTRLAYTAAAGSTVVFVQQATDWEAGMQVLLTTTVFYDCPSNYQSEYCSNNAHQNEVMTIKAVSNDRTGNGEFAVEFTSALAFSHYAGPEYQGEVGLLSRKVKVWGATDLANIGAHQIVAGAAAEGRWSGVQVDNGGQLNIEARYPFHLHLLSQVNGQRSYVQDSSVTNSNFRCVVVHQTSDTNVKRNVFYNAKGMCVYLEDGLEERNSIHHNLAAHVHPIKKPANGGYGQGGEQFDAAADLIVPADTSASGFYIPNAYNCYIGNAASGGWSGFAFPNTPKPIGLAQGQDLGDRDPENRPTQEFRGNSAHSAGFYWQGHGSCFYTGARHYFDSVAGIMKYDSGRHARSTTDENGNEQWMVFDDMKAFLCRKAVAHWGNQIIMRRFEFHDSESVGAMVFGEAALLDGLMTGRSGNSLGVAQIGTGLWGFQFYDTWVKIVLNKVTFRNFQSSSGDTVIRFMDHSDQFLPQGINAVKGLRFENVDDNAILGIRQCGPDCGGTELSTTMSSKIYTIWDYDGSLVGAHSTRASKLGRPQILGSNRNWWSLGTSDCVNTGYAGQENMWSCDWTDARQIVYTNLYIPGIMDGCNSAFGGCSGQKASYTVGTVTQWGTSNAGASITMSPWSGVTGHGNVGWHWRPRAEAADGVANAAYQFNGPPTDFEVKDHQIERGHFIILSMTYPAGTTFVVTMEGWGMDGSSLPMASSLATVLQNTEPIGSGSSAFNCAGKQWNQLCTSTNGAVGPAWYFDGTNLYMRIVQPHCYRQSGINDCRDNFYFSADGIKIWDIRNGAHYKVRATNAAAPRKTVNGATIFTGVTDSRPTSGFTARLGSLTTVGTTRSTQLSCVAAVSAPQGSCLASLPPQEKCGPGELCPACAYTSCPAPVNGVARCGNINNRCGGSVFCGDCSDPTHTCSVDGYCVCRGKTCQELGYQCGLQDDGCNVGRVLDCSTCQTTLNDPRVCSTNPPGLCIPGNCTLASSCSAQNRECGTVNTYCVGTPGVPVVDNCGSCSRAQEECSGTGQCVCTPLNAQEACQAATAAGQPPASCGQHPDGCGGFVDCGSCGLNGQCLQGLFQCQGITCDAPLELMGGACQCVAPNELNALGVCEAPVAENEEVDAGASLVVSALITMVALVLSF